ncbi:MAG: hypothetical protein II855_04510 [Candidatus Methanomethylophilaceae archaeon]|nr:hypothetical protein [Candidatus Methanomethylophilaceae archaeon]
MKDKRKGKNNLIDENVDNVHINGNYPDTEEVWKQIDQMRYDILKLNINTMMIKVLLERHLKIRINTFSKEEDIIDEETASRGLAILFGTGSGEDEGDEKDESGYDDIMVGSKTSEEDLDIIIKFITKKYSLTNDITERKAKRILRLVKKLPFDVYLGDFLDDIDSVDYSELEHLLERIPFTSDVLMDSDALLDEIESVKDLIEGLKD